MVKKEIVQEIIDKNSATFLEAKDFRQVSEIFAWPESRIALRNYIAQLEDCDLIDLIALMDYGRELCHMPRPATYEGFLKTRNAWGLGVLSAEEKQHQANYLLGKRDLSQYLNATLPLFDDTDSKF